VNAKKVENKKSTFQTNVELEQTANELLKSTNCSQKKKIKKV
jgi:hypothetical protein